MIKWKLKTWCTIFFLVFENITSRFTYFSWNKNRIRYLWTSIFCLLHPFRFGFSEWFYYELAGKSLYQPTSNCLISNLSISILAIPIHSSDKSWLSYLVSGDILVNTLVTKILRDTSDVRYFTVCLYNGLQSCRTMLVFRVRKRRSFSQSWVVTNVSENKMFWWFFRNENEWVYMKISIPGYPELPFGRFRADTISISR